MRAHEGTPRTISIHKPQKTKLLFSATKKARANRDYLTRTSYMRLYLQSTEKTSFLYIFMRTHLDRLPPAQMNETGMLANPILVPMERTPETKMEDELLKKSHTDCGVDLSCEFICKSLILIPCITHNHWFAFRTSPSLENR